MEDYLENNWTESLLIPKNEEERTPMKVSPRPNETNADSVGNLIRPSLNDDQRSPPMEASPIKLIKERERSKIKL